MNDGPRVALAHDYLSVFGGAERVVLSLGKAFPDAPVYTSVHNPALTFPELDEHEIVTTGLNRSRLLRRHYRLAMPLLPHAFGHLRVDAVDAVVCSSSGWAHGIATDAPKIVYCHNPARWLYQGCEYGRGRTRYRAAAKLTRPLLKPWDQRAAQSCARYVANSQVVAERIGAVYGFEAEVVPPPVGLDITGPRRAVDGLEPGGFFLSVGRLQPYKHVDVLVEAFRSLGPSHRLVVAGDGPMRREIESIAPPNVRFLGRVDDAELRWLYASAAGLLSAAYEDFGLTPVEAAMFGTPSALLRHNGFLDTMVEGVNGVFFDAPDPSAVAIAVKELDATRWDGAAIVRSADRFSQHGFATRLHEIVREVVGEHRMPARAASASAA